MENVQQNDWFATILYNPDKDFKNFKEAGLDATNTGLKDRESYKDIQAVQDQFKDAEGNFDEKLYNQFYDSAVRTYNTFVQGNIEDTFLRNMVKSPLDILSDRSTPSQKPLFIVQKDLILLLNHKVLTAYLEKVKLLGLTEKQLKLKEL